MERALVVMLQFLTKLYIHHHIVYKMIMEVFFGRAKLVGLKTNSKKSRLYSTVLFLE